MANASIRFEVARLVAAMDALQARLATGLTEDLAERVERFLTAVDAGDIKLFDRHYVAAGTVEDPGLLVTHLDPSEAFRDLLAALGATPASGVTS